MTTDPRNPGTESPARRGTSGPAAPPSGTAETLREIGDGIVVLWWRFFDWLAVVPWKTLLVVSFLGLILAAMIKPRTGSSCSSSPRSSSRWWRAASAGRN